MLKRKNIKFSFAYYFFLNTFSYKYNKQVSSISFPRAREGITAENFKSSKLHQVAKYLNVTTNRSYAEIDFQITVLFLEMYELTKSKSL